MYAYEVIFLGPRRDRQVGLRFISTIRYASVIALLRAHDQYEEYRHWTLLSFRCAHADSPNSTPREVIREVAPPGTLVATSA
jgi:hypothetical protein